jgi:cytochrome c5
MDGADGWPRPSWIAAAAVVAVAPLLLVACGDGPGGRGADGTDGMMRMMGGRGMELPEGVPASDLPDPDGRGAGLVAAYCGQCHGLPSPRRHTAEDWEATARRMFRRMAHMEGMRGGMMDVEAPTADEERAILEYLREHAMLGATDAALPDSPGRDAFARICSRCHALPDPRQHEADEWPAVVERMRGHMDRMEVEGISDAEADRVVRYLRAASGR